MRLAGRWSQFSCCEVSSLLSIYTPNTILLRVILFTHHARLGFGALVLCGTGNRTVYLL
jgi:hypothetical protein